MSVSTVLVRVLVEAVERAGIPRQDLLESQGIDPARLVEVDARFALKEFAGLQMRAMDLTRDESLGLRIAERTPDASFELMAHLVSHAPTLREALGLCAQFQDLILDDCRITLRATATSAAIHYQFARSVERADRMLAELVVA